MYFKHLRGQHDQRDHGRPRKFGGPSGIIQAAPSRSSQDNAVDYVVAKNNILSYLFNKDDYKTGIPFRNNPINAVAHLTASLPSKKPSKEEVSSLIEYEAITDIRKKIMSFASRFSKAKTDAGRNKVLSEYQEYLQGQVKIPESKLDKKTKKMDEQQRRLDSKRHPTKGAYINGVYVASQRGIEFARKLRPYNSLFSDRRIMSQDEARLNVQAAMDSLTEALSVYRKSAKTPDDERKLNEATTRLKQAEDKEAVVRTNPFKDIPDDAFPFKHGVDAIQIPNIKFGYSQSPEFADQNQNLLTTINEALNGLVRFIPPNDRNGNPVTVFPQLRVRKTTDLGPFYRFTDSGGATIRIDETDVGTAAHELMHAIEDSHPELKRRIKDFFDYRTRKDQVTIVDFTNSYYDTRFEAKLDLWGDEYTGRVYSKEDGGYRIGPGSEVLTMIISSMRDFRSVPTLGPENTLKDEEHVAFFIDVLSDPESWG